ncbi:MAG: glycosyltransferase [Bacteroidetes bacterium]|nr:glycosyltransferase [Bacteroidota bacterium]
MRIVYLSTFYPFRGGIAQFNACLYRAFENAGHEVKAFTFTTQYPSLLFPGKTQMAGEKDTADKIPAERILSSVNPLSYFTAAKKIGRFCPDVLIMKYWIPYFAPSLGTVAWALKKKSKVIAILDNVIPHERRPGDVALTKFFLHQCHGFVVMSDKVKNDLLSLKPDAKFIYHPHPLYNHFGKKIDKTEAQKQLGIPKGKKVLLFFGFIRKYKGLDILIEAMKFLPAEYHLIIAGEVYGSFEEYDEIIRKHNLEGKITKHARYISDHEVSLFFSAADVCVLPYRSATQSGITSIAFHFDVPVIATRVGGLGEIVVDRKTGLLAGEAQVEPIGRKIMEFFSLPGEINMVENIRKVKEELSWERLAGAICGFAADLTGF